MMVQQQQSTDRKKVFHDINNRINALSIAIGILQQSSSSDVRKISNIMEEELDMLHSMIEELRFSC